VAGTGEAGDCDGDALSAAELHSPVALALDATGDLLVCDQDAQRIRKVIFSPQSSNSKPATASAAAAAAPASASATSASAASAAPAAAAPASSVPSNS
jgi:hypothetical protein